MRAPEEAAAEDYEAIMSSAGWRRAERDALVVSGPEAVAFLQGQLSQEVASLPPGESAHSLVLSPQGKVDALVRVTRTGPEEILVDLEGGYGAALAERLGRFKLRTRAELAAREVRCVQVRGPLVDSHLEVACDGRPGEVALGEIRRCVALPASWPALDGVDLVGPDPTPPSWARPCGAQAFEAARIEAGIPAMGSELDASTIPAEAGLNERTVSFTKGCFTGQELVARLEARGNRVARRLRAVVAEASDSGQVPPPGALVLAAGKQQGRLTSVVWSPGRRRPVALAYVSRQVEPPASVELAWDAGSERGEVLELPISATRPSRS